MAKKQKFVFSNTAKKLTEAEIKRLYPKDKDGNPILISGVVRVKAISRKQIKQGV